MRLLSGILASSQQARVGAERVLELLDLEPVVKQAADAAPLTDCRGRIDLHQVTFAHGDKPPILKQLSLHVAVGERLGLVGGLRIGQDHARLVAGALL